MTPTRVQTKSSEQSHTQDKCLSFNMYYMKKKTYLNGTKAREYTFIYTCTYIYLKKQP